MDFLLHHLLSADVFICRHHNLCSFHSLRLFPAISFLVPQIAIRLFKLRRFLIQLAHALKQRIRLFFRRRHLRSVRFGVRWFFSVVAQKAVILAAWILAQTDAVFFGTLVRVGLNPRFGLFWLSFCLVWLEGGLGGRGLRRKFGLPWTLSCGALGEF